MQVLGVLSYDELCHIFSFRFLSGLPGNVERTYSYHSAIIWNNLILLVITTFYEISA